MRTFRRAIVGVAAMLCSLVMAVPAGAQQGPPDPQTLDELRDSVAYRSDHGDVLRLYRAFFDREPDVVGASYWMDVYDKGGSLDDLAWGFAQSEEFRLTYGGSVSNEQFLTLLYRNMLGRAPDPTGYAYWLDQMQNGLSQDGVVRWVVANEEFINNYPYTDLRADVSTIALSLEDFVAGWVQLTEGVEGRTGCVTIFDLPEKATKVGFASSTSVFSPAVVQTIYSFATTALAEEYMAEARSQAQGCSSFATDGIQATLGEISYNDYGDDRVAYQGEIGIEQAISLDQQYVIVRYGSTVITTNRVSAFGVFTWETEPFVELTLARLIVLAN